MTDSLFIALAMVAGGMAGVLFFGGLWLTVRRLPTARHPALWMVGGTLLRFAVALATFFFIGRGHLDRLLACLAGFIIARLLVTRFTRPRTSEENPPCT